MERIVKILYVEDDSAEVFILKENLSQAPDFQFDFTHCSDLTSAFETLKTTSFDIVLLDLGLPESSGIETLRKFLSVHDQTAVVVVTGLDDFETSITAIETGAQDYIIKGQYQPFMIVKTIKFAIERKKMQEVSKKHSKLESLSLLAGGIAHDFNNVLTVILGYIELAKAYTEKETVENFLIKSSQMVDRAQEISNRFVTFAKGGVISKNVHDAVSLVKDAVMSEAGTKCPLKFLNDDKELRCRVDRTQITLAVRNIVNNSVEACSKEDGLITVDFSKCDELPEQVLDSDTDFLKITFMDNGKGIKKEDIDKVFDPYYTTKNFGTGFGLTIALSVMKEHNGTIKIDSEINKGTTVSIYLPLEN
jgi:signal transduction histidine kinase